MGVGELVPDAADTLFEGIKALRQGDIGWQTVPLSNSSW